MISLENPSFNNVEAFCRTYEGNSFTAAARALGVAPQSASRAVARLEAHLGVTLFRRTTRALQPTEDGRAYYRSCRQAIELLRSSAQTLTAARASTSGHVRVSVPTTYGHHILLPALAEFRKKFPDITVEVHVSNRSIDFVADGYDCAIRMGEPPDSSLVARKLGDYSVGVFASPSYLASAGTPKHPNQLANHSCIGFLMPRTGRLLPWVFSSAPLQLEPNCKFLVSDDVLGTVTLATAGVGLVQLYHYTVADQLANGELVEVLAAFSGRTRKFSILYQRESRPSRAVKAFVEFALANTSSRRPKRAKRVGRPS